MLMFGEDDCDDDCDHDYDGGIDFFGFRRSDGDARVCGGRVMARVRNLTRTTAAAAAVA